MKKIFAIILLGRPGSGKGTQAELLAKKLGFFHFQMSKLLKEVFAKNKNNQQIKKEEEKFKAGKLVNLDFVINIDIETIRKIRKQNKGIVFDGSFRKLGETKKVLPVLIEQYGKENIKILDVHISEKESVWRNTKRRVCKKCGSPVPYSSHTKDLKFCDQKECDGELITRSDDNPTIIKKRLKIFMKETHPVIQFLKQNKMLVEINGEQSIEDVFCEILKKLKM